MIKDVLPGDIKTFIGSKSNLIYIQLFNGEKWVIDFLWIMCSPKLG